MCLAKSFSQHGQLDRPSSMQILFLVMTRSEPEYICGKSSQPFAPGSNADASVCTSTAVLLLFMLALLPRRQVSTRCVKTEDMNFLFAFRFLSAGLGESRPTDLCPTTVEYISAKHVRRATLSIMGACQLVIGDRDLAWSQLAQKLRSYNIIRGLNIVKLKLYNIKLYNKHFLRKGSCGSSKEARILFFLFSEFRN